MITILWSQLGCYCVTTAKFTINIWEIYKKWPNNTGGHGLALHGDKGAQGSLFASIYDVFVCLSSLTPRSKGNDNFSGF